MRMILTSECELCEYGAIDESDKARIKVKCGLRGKVYHYGQRVPCEDRKARREEKYEENGSTV